jgi:hypothetical protein
MQSGQPAGRPSAVSVNIATFVRFSTEPTVTATHTTRSEGGNDLMSNVHINDVLCTEMYGMTVRSGCHLRPVNVGFTVDRVTLGQAFSQYFGFPVSIIPPLLHTPLIYSFIHSSIHPSILPTPTLHNVSNCQRHQSTSLSHTSWQQKYAATFVLLVTANPTCSKTQAHNFCLHTLY